MQGAAERTHGGLEPGTLKQSKVLGNVSQTHRTAGACLMEGSGTLGRCMT